VWGYSIKIGAVLLGVSMTHPKKTPPRTAAGAFFRIVENVTLEA
jgi:hypothetical protein